MISDWFLSTIAGSLSVMINRGTGVNPMTLKLAVAEGDTDAIDEQDGQAIGTLAGVTVRPRDLERRIDCAVRSSDEKYAG